MDGILKNFLTRYQSLYYIFIYIIHINTDKIVNHMQRKYHLLRSWK